MLLFSSLEEARKLGSTAVTIGKFDGIHRGHLALISALEAAADEHNLKSVLVTFDRHPDALLNPGNLKWPLIGPQQKAALVAEAGLDALLTLTFDEVLAQQSAQEFVQETLVNGLQAKLVIVGEDFRFGAGGAGDVALLHELGQQLGFEVRVIPSANEAGLKVSTSAIRELLDLGDVAKAAELLGRVHTTVGVVEHGLKIGRTIGFPTANMSREAEGYLPLDGVYAGWLVADGQRYPAAHSVGINETFQAVPRLVESHVLDRKDLDLYDKVVTLEYIDFVRPSAKFDGVESLVAEINRDLDKIRNILGL
ncbi:MAG: bifunctional riboflavin kinase/FAD synthetase [Rhodoluna sp.]|nr:bifunctional riboflavin kinase/FAD synthetase [Rhodoluna sp.]